MRGGLVASTWCPRLTAVAGATFPLQSELKTVTRGIESASDRIKGWLRVITAVWMDDQQACS